MKSMLAVALAFALGAVAHADPPTVVLFVTDDQGDVAGCYGYDDAVTPSIDALAEDAALFANAFCTTASCSPSRAAMLSGLHGHANGMYGLQHAKHHFESFDDVRSLSSLLADAGWTTARIGKFHVSPEPSYPFEHALRGPAGNPVAMANVVGEFMDGLGDEPLFLLFGTSDPHRGGGARDDLPGRPDRFGNRNKEGVTPVVFDPSGVQLPPWLPDTIEARAEWAQMLESINRVDQGLARLVERLRAAERWEQTLFIFVSDHGPAFPGAKTTVYEPGLRTSMIVRDPRASSRGNRVEIQASLIDIVPTILDWCEVERPERLHGRSLVHWARGATVEPWVDEVYASHTFHEVTMYYPMRVVRTPRYKLIWNIAHQLPYPFASDLHRSSTWQAALAAGPESMYGMRTVDAYVHRAEFELYDLETDPHETKNLAGDPAHAETLEQLQRKLREFQRSTGDQWQLKWNRE